MKRYRWLKMFVVAIAVMGLVLGAVAIGWAAEQPKKGGWIIYGRGGDSVGLDPVNVTDGESLKVTRNIFDGLVTYDKYSTDVVPALATRWEVSKDEKTWTFYLRKGVKFHDGTPFNADAVVFNFERWMNKDNPYHQGEFEYYGYMFGGYPGIIKSVKAKDDYTVVFTLEKPQATFLSNLAMDCFAISSPAAIKKWKADYFKHPVGTGPFVFKEWVKDDKIVLEANKDYWGEGPYVDGVIFRAIKDNSARLMELQSGTINIADGINPDEVALIKKDKNLKVYLRPAMNVGYLAMNFDKKPFDNVLVRRAINYAIDKKAIIDAFYAGLAEPAKNPMPPMMWGYNNDIKDYEYNPAKAKELLKQAGFPNGFKTTLWAMPVPRPYMPQPRKIGEAIQGYLAAVGIQAEIVSWDWATYLAKTENGEHDMALLGWTGDNGDPDNFLYVLLDKDNAVKGSAGNIAFYRSDKLHDLLIKAQQVSDKATRTKLYKEAQVVIHEDAPWVPIAHSLAPTAAVANLRNYVPHATGAEPFNDLWFDK